jgi:hypothetical protein
VLAKTKVLGVAGRVLDFADCNLHPAHDAFILSNWGWLVQFILCATESGRNNSAVKSGIGRFDLGLGGCEQLSSPRVFGTVTRSLHLFFANGCIRSSQ